MSKRIPILVIDDEEHARIVLEYCLKLYGFEVYLAADGASGLELAHEKKPKAILLDWMMPEMDGLEVLSELKHDGTTEHIPVFMLSTKAELSDIEWAFDIGADDYITKPFNIKKLGKILKEKLQKHAKLKSK